MFIRIVPLLLIAGLATGPLAAQTDPFIGQWKLTKFTDRMTVAKAGANMYVFNFEGGGPEKIVVDGTFQPGIGGTLLSVAPVGSNWKVIRTRDGQKLLIATWTLSKDGSTLTDDFTSFDKNGAPSNIKGVFQRGTAGTGFTGTWVSQSEAINSVTILEISPYKSDGLTLFVPSESLRANLIVDGKKVRRIDARTMEVTRTSNGAITQTEEYTVSSDLKTLKHIVHVVGESRPLVSVFERVG